MKRVYFLWAIALLLPAGLKLGVPALLNRQTILASNPSFSTVQAISGNQLTVRSPNGLTQTIQLVGLSPLPHHWKQEAVGVLSALLKASDGQIDVVKMHTSDEQTLALAKLPNGTLIQSILLAEGLAKLDSQQLYTLPPDVLALLQQAQRSAQQQHKNLWGQ